MTPARGLDADPLLRDIGAQGEAVPNATTLRAKDGVRAALAARSPDAGLDRATPLVVATGRARGDTPRLLRPTPFPRPTPTVQDRPQEGHTDGGRAAEARPVAGGLVRRPPALVVPAPQGQGAGVGRLGHSCPHKHTCGVW